MKTMVCHGDSLTEGADLNPNYTWPLLVENQVKVKIINSGIGGDTSGGLLGRFYPDVIRHKPEMVLIMGGTNDLWWDLDVNLIQANIFAMTCQAEFHNIAPVVGLPLPLYMANIRQQKMMAPIGGWENCVRKLERLVDALATSAGENDIAKRCINGKLQACGLTVGALSTQVKDLAVLELPYLFLDFKEFSMLL